MLALVPLDDRPCNVRFPQQIAAIGGDQIIVPPLSALGHFNNPGQPADVTRWLLDTGPVDALIVSIDMLAYGGLVASRKPRVTEDEALSRLEALRTFRRAHPGVPIYAFNILMRLAITMDSDEAVPHYYNIMRFARLADEAERFHSDYLRTELEKVRREIPPALLEEYLQARARNHAVNLRMVDLLGEGLFDYLLITQEDATEYGLHRREQDEILQRVREQGTEDKFSLHPGADEAALTLLARHWNTGVSFRVHPSDRDDMQRIAPFEDRPYGLALEQHVESMLGRIVEGENADFELFVNAPVGGSQRDEDETARNARRSRLQSFVSDIIDQANADTLPTDTDHNGTAHRGHLWSRVAICDVAFPNGADNLLMTELDRPGLFSQVAAYSGWNTAGNATGTILAQCAAIKRVRETGDAAQQATSHALNRQFMFERLVDDWCYQSQVRGRIERAAREIGLVPHNMGDEGEPVEAQARRELRGYAQLLAKRHFNLALRRSEITLPWRRAFEADVRVELV